MPNSKKTGAAPRDSSPKTAKSKRSGKLNERRELTREEHEARRLRLKQQNDLLDRSEARLAEAENHRKTRSATRREREIASEQIADAPSQRPANPAEDDGKTEVRKPWETLVIGVNLGDGLSRLEYKDREIMQQRFILAHYETNSPNDVEHHQKLLEELIQEREEMEADEDNHLPAAQLDAKARVEERVETLHWALDTCQFKGEAVNIRAALEGYASGRIEYSDNFTLIYGGHIVDVCPTYQSFCVDRADRIRRYADRHGDGWLWIETPLAGASDMMLAMKGMPLDQERSSSWGIGHYAIHLNFEVDTSQVMNEDEKKKGGADLKDRSEETGKKYEAQFKTLLDSGATVPVIHVNDLRHLNIDLNWYASQGVSHTSTANGDVRQRFFEMYVSLCTEESESLVGLHNPATWPTERPVLGAFLPVVVSRNQALQGRLSFLSRLSGMLPFDAAYISSAPARKRLWLGEDRRDVLGASRLPAHLRYDTGKNLEIIYPEDFDEVRQGLKTPDAVMFAHELENPEGTFIDSEPPAQRGKSQWTIQEPDPSGTMRDYSADIGPHVGEAHVVATPGWRKEHLTASKIRKINRTDPLPK